MTNLSIYLLGTPEIRLDGVPLSSALSTKAKALLAYLAVEDHRPHSRETLAFLLWPDGPSQAARSNLRGALRELRRALALPPSETPFLCISRDAIKFNPASSYWIDIRAFERAVFDSPAHPTQDADRLLAALALYRGSFLEELTVNAAPFEEWALIQREVWQRQAIETMGQLTAALETRGDYALARDVAHRQLELDPWCEVAHCRLMRLLALDGRRSEALAQYEICRRALDQELGVEPSLEAKLLYHQIRDDSLARPLHSALEDHRSPPEGIDASAQMLTVQSGADQRQRLTRLATLLDAAVRGHTSLFVIVSRPADGGNTYLGVQGLDREDLICLHKAVGQALKMLCTMG